MVHDAAAAGLNGSADVIGERTGTRLRSSLLALHPTLHTLRTSSASRTAAVLREEARIVRARPGLVTLGRPYKDAVCALQWRQRFAIEQCKTKGTHEPTQLPVLVVARGGGCVLHPLVLAVTARS